MEKVAFGNTLPMPSVICSAANPDKQRGRVILKAVLDDRFVADRGRNGVDHQGGSRSRIAPIKGP